jgi:hypothetical protein
MVTRRALLALALLLRASAASAQASEDAPAKQYFEAGLEQLRAQQWSAAEAQFRSSLALVPRASTEYDLAFVLFKQGKLRESAEHLRRLLDPQQYADDARYAPAAKALLAEVVAQQPTLQLEIAPPHAQLRVDGELITGSGSPRTLALDPGVHRIELSANGFVARSLNISASAQTHDQREIALAPETPARSAPAPALAATPTPPAPVDSWSAAYGPWIVIGVGAALLVSAGITGIMAEHADANFTHQCPSHHDCDPQLKSLQNQVAALGLASDVLLAAGAAITVGGVALRLTIDPAGRDEQRGVALRTVATLRY